MLKQPGTGTAKARCAMRGFEGESTNKDIFASTAVAAAGLRRQRYTVLTAFVRTALLDANGNVGRTHRAHKTATLEGDQRLQTIELLIQELPPVAVQDVSGKDCVRDAVPFLWTRRDIAVVPHFCGTLSFVRGCTESARF